MTRGLYLSSLHIERNDSRPPQRNIIPASSIHVLSAVRILVISLTAAGILTVDFRVFVCVVVLGWLSSLFILLVFQVVVERFAGL